MTYLYNLKLRRHIKGMVQGPVKTQSAGIIGHYLPDSDIPVMPDHASVLSCLPPCYRKAFERTNHWWFNHEGNQPVTYCYLYDRKHRFVNTIEAQLYEVQS